MKAPLFAGATHPGLVRGQNQDAVHLPRGQAGPGRLALVLADGMGGANGGQLASRLAVEAISMALADSQALEPSQALALAVDRAAQALSQAARGRPELQGMGTTVVALLLEGPRAWVANLGDSRCYLWRRGRLEQVTQDHSLVRRLVEQGSITPEEAKSHQMRHVLTRVLGTKGPVEADLFPLDLLPGDRLLLCSDGLHGPVAPEALALALAGPETPGEKVARLIDLANQKGGPDNISAIVAQMPEPAPGDEPGALGP